MGPFAPSTAGQTMQVAGKCGWLAKFEGIDGSTQI